MLRNHDAKYSVLLRVVGRMDKERRKAEKVALDVASTFKPALFAKHGQKYIQKWIKAVVAKKLAAVAKSGFETGRKNAKEFQDVKHG